MNGKSKFGFWTYIAIIFILVIAVVYYQGLTQDISAVGPYVLSFAELAQGRNPQTGAFSNYPTTQKAGS